MEEVAAAIFRVLNIVFHYKLFILQISKLTDTDMPFLIDENPV